MSIADTAQHRTDWQHKAATVNREIEDLRSEILIALHAPTATDTTIALAEADVHLDVAQHELDEAITRINTIT